MNLSNKEVLRIFPTLVFKGKVQDPSVIDQAVDTVLKMKEGGMGTYNQNKFSTHDNLQNYPTFQPLVELVMNETSSVLDFMAVQRDSHYITGMWSHVTGKGHRHPVHNHPNNYLSGLIYLRAPINCGNTIFIDPRNGSQMIKPDYTEANYFNMSTFIHRPETGVMLIWPSWLPHMVDYDSEENDEQRIVVSFNVMIKGSVNRISEKVVY
jgi:uncharacterized protein (TIGR02466 family)